MLAKAEKRVADAARELKSATRFLAKVKTMKDPVQAAQDSAGQAETK